MSRGIVVVGLVLGLTGAPERAEAKRAPAPKTEICNKTKHKQYVATMTYAGRGFRRVEGWTFIAPGKCRTFQEDRYYVRGKAKVSGLMAERSAKACVKATKVFSDVAQLDDLGDAGRCREAKGKLVEFRSPIVEVPASGMPRSTRPVVIGP